MYDRVLHNHWSKLATAVAGAVLMAVAINLFIVPQGLYTGGLLGLCQVIRTLLVTKLGVTANFDIAGLIYLASNVPREEEIHHAARGTVQIVHQAHVSAPSFSLRRRPL